MSEGSKVCGREYICMYVHSNAMMSILVHFLMKAIEHAGLDSNVWVGWWCGLLRDGGREWVGEGQICNLWVYKCPLSKWFN